MEQKQYKTPEYMRKSSSRYYDKNKAEISARNKEKRLAEKQKKMK